MIRRFTSIAPFLAVAVACGPIRSTTTPLDVAAPAPELGLEDQRGQPITIAELTAEGPALLVFNRGHR